MKRINKILFSTLLASVMALAATYVPTVDGNVNVNGTLPEAGGTNRVVAETISEESDGAGEPEAVSTEPAPELIELSGGNIEAKKLLQNKGFTTSERMFSSIRFGTTLGTDKITQSMADSNPYGWPTVYLGVKDAEKDYYDISQATDFYIFLKNVTGSTPKIKWRAVDSDGTVQRIVNYSDKSKGDMRSLAGETTAVNTNSDYRGNYVSTTDEGVFLHSVYAEDSVMTTAQIDADSAEFASGANKTFDSTKVVAFMLSIYSYGAKTFDIGSMTAKIGGEEVVLWDADEASEKKYDDIFTSETNSFSDFKLNKNEWYLGAIPASIATDSSDWETDYGIVTDYQNAEALEYTYADGATDAWVPLYEDDGLNYVKNETTMDLSACNAMVFDADFTGANGTSAIDFMIRPKDASGLIKYKSTGRAFLIAENGTLTTCGGNAYPAGFKGKVILPFTSFQKENETSVLLSNCEYLNNVQHITAIIITTRSNTYQAGDTVKLSNIQVLKKTEQELDFLNKVAEFRLNFKMQETAELCYDPFGIRFGVTVGNKVYTDVVEALEGVSYEFGMVIVPDTDAYASVMPNQEGILTVKKVLSGEESEDTYWYSWYAGIIQIGSGGYQIKFVARAYLQYTLDGTTYTVWATTESNGVSLYELAAAAKENGVNNTDVGAVIAHVEGNQ